LFWTTRIPLRNVDIDLTEGNARMVAQGVPVLDHHQIPNAISGMGPAPEPATVSFRVEWGGGGDPVPVQNDAQGFAGAFIRNSAQMEWTARVGNYLFESAPLETSSSSFAEIGRERNGIFLSSA
jgi:hypothetical protein